jgi:hypothetical protein
MTRRRSGVLAVVVLLGLASVCAAQWALPWRAHRRPTHPTVLGSCPLPGFCYRTQLSSQELSSDWSTEPKDKNLSTYKVAVQQHIQSDAFKVPPKEPGNLLPSRSLFNPFHYTKLLP